MQKEKERRGESRRVNEQGGKSDYERETLVWHVSDRTRITTQAGSSSC